MDPEELRILFASARKARGRGADTKKINARIVELTQGKASNMQSLASLVGKQSERVTAEESPSLGKFAGTAQAVGQGLTFNLLDEAVGLVAPETGAEIRSRSERFRESNPVLSTIGEVAGAIVPAIAGGAGLAARAPGVANALSRTLGHRLIGGSLAGAAEGALSEAGRAESGERLGAGLQGAAFGAAGGGLGTAGVGALTPLLSVVGRRLPGAAGRRAGRQLANVVEDAGGEQELARLANKAQRVGGETAGELKLLDATGTKFGEAAELDAIALRQAQDVIERRAARSPGRVKQQTEFALGVEDSAEELRQLAASQRKTAKEAYDALSAEDQLFPTDVFDDALRTVNADGSLGELRAPAKKALKAAERNRATAGEIALPEGQLDFDALQKIKLDLDRQVTAAYRKGDPGTVASLRAMRTGFLDRMNQIVDNFAPTQAQFQGAAQIDDALVQGSNIARKSAQEVRDDLLQIGDDAVLLRSYRAGAAEGVGEHIGRRENPVKLFNDDLRTKIGLLAPEGSDLGRLDDALDLEKLLMEAKVPKQVATQPFAQQAQADRPLGRLFDPSGKGDPSQTGSIVPRGLGLFGGINQQGALARTAGSASPADLTNRAVIGQSAQPLNQSAIADIIRRRQGSLLNNITSRTGVPGAAGGLLGGLLNR